MGGFSDMQVDIFISYKATDSGATTEDALRAEALYRALVQKGYRVFFSKESIPNGGSGDFHKEIDAALDAAKLLVVVATKVEYVNSRWVEYEWKSFNADILSNIKTDAQIITYTGGVDTRLLPRVLRYSQNFAFDDLATLLVFVDSVFQKKQDAPSAVMQDLSLPCGTTPDYTFYNSAWSGEFDVLKIRSLRNYALDISAIESAKNEMKREKYNVLVVGCAYGHVAQTRFGLDDAVENVICIDRNPAVLERAREIYRDYPHMKFFEVDVEKDSYLPTMAKIFSELGIASVDMVFSTELLRYLNNPSAFIRNSRKLLNQGGMLLLREGDDENKMSYPDHENVLQSIIRKSSTLHGMPNYRIGRELPLLLGNNGFSVFDILSDMQCTVGLSFEEKEDFFKASFACRRTLAENLAAAKEGSEQREIDEFCALIDRFEAMFYEINFWYTEFSLLCIGKKGS